MKSVHAFHAACPDLLVFTELLIQQRARPARTLTRLVLRQHCRAVVAKLVRRARHAIPNVARRAHDTDQKRADGATHTPRGILLILQQSPRARHARPGVCVDGVRVGAGHAHVLDQHAVGRTRSCAGDAVRLAAAARQMHRTRPAEPKVVARRKILWTFAAEICCRGIRILPGWAPQRIGPARRVIVDDVRGGGRGGRRGVRCLANCIMRGAVAGRDLNKRRHARLARLAPRGGVVGKVAGRARHGARLAQGACAPRVRSVPTERRARRTKAVRDAAIFTCKNIGGFGRGGRCRVAALFVAKDDAPGLRCVVGDQSDARNRRVEGGKECTGRDVAAGGGVAPAPPRVVGVEGEAVGGRAGCLAGGAVVAGWTARKVRRGGCVLVVDEELGAVVGVARKNEAIRSRAEVLAHAGDAAARRGECEAAEHDAPVAHACEAGSMRVYTVGRRRAQASESLFDCRDVG